MVLVDTSVWVDYFNGVGSRQTDILDALLCSELIAVGDLILAEVLQGFRSERDFNQAKNYLEPLPFYLLGGRDIAIASAKNFRTLRKQGITVRKTIDVLIATAAIYYGFELLHNDRDFDAMQSIGLKYHRG